MMARDRSGELLCGLSVVEIPGRTAVSACTQLLSMLGANVVVISDQDDPDPRVAHRRAIFDRTKSGSLSAASASASTWSDDARNADVFVFSSDSGNLKEQLRNAVAADLIMCDVTAFGRDEMAIFGNSEQTVQALSGVAFTTGHLESCPTVTKVPYLEMQTAVYAACAIITAVLARKQRGGQLIDMAVYDVAVNAMLTFLPGLFSGGKPMRCGNRHPSLVPWNCFKCIDSWVNICAPSDDQWSRLSGAMLRKELISDVRFRNAQARLNNVEELNQIISAWCATRTVADVVSTLIACSVPVGTVTLLSDLAREPNLVHRRTIETVPGSGPQENSHYMRCPIKCWGRVVDASKTTSCRLASGDEVDAWDVIDPVGSQSTRSDGPLKGVRVLEIGTNTVAPLAARQLGALGARVLKVEPPTGEPSRTNAPFQSDGSSYAFALSNTDKSSIALDLKNEHARATLRGLLSSADILIENLKPGSLDKLGFGHKQLRNTLPHLIYCSASGFGIDSVYASRPAFDSIIQGMAGIMSTLDADSPTKTGVSTADLLGGQFSLLACLAALYHRTEVGVAVSIDISMQDCAVWATQEAWNGGEALLEHAVSFAVADGWISIESRNGQSPEIPEGFARNISTKDRLEAVALVNASDKLKAVPIRTVCEAVANGMTLRRHLFQRVLSENGEAWTVLSSPLKLTRTPPTVARVMPTLRIIATASAEVA